MSFQRMVLISQASYSELKYSQPPNDQQQILERPDIPDDEKQMVYLNNWGMKRKVWLQHLKIFPILTNGWN